ncbi:MAG: CPBP family intramembrane glutamic endopeptidase [Candidatus Hodarchaeales archaeon]
MNEQVLETNVEKLISDDVPAKELLLLSIPISILFAITGMDFIGFFIYLATRTSSAEIYTRSLLNVLLIGFLLTTIVLFVVPFLINNFRWKKPLAYFGTQKGNWKIGLIVVGVVILFMPILFMPLLYFNSQEQIMINTYPLTKDVVFSWPIFALYELSYIVFYYIPYEFYFRGVLQLGLSKTRKKWQSILFVTILTTVLHATKPWSEIVAALIAGILFGILAEKTDSWIYVFLIHITAGVLTDTFCALGYLGVL